MYISGYLWYAENFRCHHIQLFLKPCVSQSWDIILTSTVWQSLVDGETICLRPISLVLLSTNYTTVKACSPSLIDQSLHERPTFGFRTTQSRACWGYAPQCLAVFSSRSLQEKELVNKNSKFSKCKPYNKCNFVLPIVLWIILNGSPLQTNVEEDKFWICVTTVNNCTATNKLKKNCLYNTTVYIFHVRAQIHFYFVQEKKNEGALLHRWVLFNIIMRVACFWPYAFKHEVWLDNSRISPLWLYNADLTL